MVWAMATYHDAITDRQRALIESAHLFFVASVAPDLSGGPDGQGPVNVSPKGARSLRMGGSVALDLVDVALGRAQRAMALGARVWDYAAGQVLVEQTGGRITTWPVGRGVDLLAEGPRPD